jgi:hypothetical protein
MNPYLEQESAWHDFHTSFIAQIRTVLTPQVVPRYFVKIEETRSDAERARYLEIRDRKLRELITVLELLSPSNKRAGPDRERCEAERHELMASTVHFVGIDLLRGGRRMPLRNPIDCDYCVLVSRAERRPEAGIWALHLRDRLPEIPVPLRTGEPDVRIDLQQILHSVYDTASYGLYIYGGQPVPRLSPEDAAWAEQFLPSA